MYLTRLLLVQKQVRNSVMKNKSLRLKLETGSIMEIQNLITTLHSNKQHFAKAEDTLQRYLHAQENVKILARALLYVLWTANRLICLKPRIEMSTLTQNSELLDKLTTDQKRLKAKLAQFTKRTFKDPEIMTQFIAKSSV